MLSRLIDEAIDLLEREGCRADDPESHDLLLSSGASLAAEEQPRLRPRKVRDLLHRIPSAFNLYDRAGRKAATLAGGEAYGSAPLLATLPVCDQVRSEEGQPVRSLSAAQLPGLATALARASGFDIQGAAGVPTEVPAPVADLYRLWAGVLATPNPHLVRPTDGGSLEGLWELTRALRGSAEEAQHRPLVIVEIPAAGRQHWSRRSSHLLTQAARHGLPAAMLLPSPEEEPSPAGLPHGGLVASIATGIAGAVIHQLARPQAPLLWALPLPTLPRSEDTSARGWQLCLEAGEYLGLPTLVTVPIGEVAPAGEGRPDGAPTGSASGGNEATAGAPASLAGSAFALAAQALACGARMVAFGGHDPLRPGVLDLAVLQRDHELLPELRRLTRLGWAAAALRAWGRPLPPAAASGAETVEDVDPQSRIAPPDLRQRLTAVLTRIAERHHVTDLPLDKTHQD